MRMGWKWGKFHGDWVEMGKILRGWGGDVVIFFTVSFSGTYDFRICLNSLIETSGF